jgi:hypothetical protein
MNTNYALFVIADKMSFCRILGIMIIKRNLNKGVLILLEKLNSEFNSLTGMKGI